jgi:hypothetical protein
MSLVPTLLGGALRAASTVAPRLAGVWPSTFVPLPRAPGERTQQRA